MDVNTVRALHWLPEGQWMPGRPFMTSLCAGAIGCVSVDCCIYPLDTLRARLQAPGGFERAGGYRSLYRGMPIALMGSAPGSALFFCTFEAIQEVSLPLGLLASSAVAAVGGELVASCVRSPTELFKQRRQTNSKLSKTCSIFLGWRATVARDLPFSTIQYPLYMLSKRLFGHSGDKPLEPWKAAICGSMTSAMAATITTPLDLAQTRLMLKEPGTGDSTIVGTLRSIYAQDGPGGLFKGVVPRTLWMGLGGFIFLGSYEQAKSYLEGEHQDKGKEAGMSMVSASRLAAHDVSNTVGPLPLSQAAYLSPSTALVTCLSGALAGMAIDGALHPIDTLKARFMYSGSSALANLWTLAGMADLWKGVGMALVPAIPANAAFFTTYETLKFGLERNRLFDFRGEGSPHKTACSGMAAALGEGVASMVRTPTEALKMRLQARQDTSIYKAAATIYSHGGVRGFYIGLSAGLFLDVPFSLIQFPIYEAIKARLSMRRTSSLQRHEEISTTEVMIDGCVAGVLAGSIAGFATTPLDVIRTWHVLSPMSHDTIGKSMLETTLNVYENSGVRGLFRGCVPRTLYTAVGGGVYLGTYAACCRLLSPLLDT